MDRRSMQTKLQRAVELEFSTIPPYQTAFFSIRPGTNQDAAAAIRGVFIEEMLHMVLAGNILQSIGGALKLNGDTVPRYPLRLEFEGKYFRDREFPVNLERLSGAALCTFLRIELPEGPDWKEFVDEHCKGWDCPRDEEDFDVHGYTIGGFYDRIKADLRALVEAHGEAQVFTGDPALQIDQNYYWASGGKPLIVKDFASACEAIDVIKAQGEGSSPDTVTDGDHRYFKQPEEVAHFFRFNEVLHRRYYKDNDNPRRPPTGPALHVDYDQVHPIKQNCKSIDFIYTPTLAKLNAQFNRTYTLMLRQVEQAFNGAPHILYTAIQNSMHDLVPLAMEMVETPIYNDPRQRTGAPSFEWAIEGC